jgi:phosphonate transport system substrate-binding protein
MNFCKGAGFARLALLLAVAFVNVEAVGQQSRSANPQERLLFAINEGGAGNLDATEILLRYEELGHIIEKALRKPVSIVAVRERKALEDGIKRGAFALVLTRPVDLPAEAVRDHRYHPVVSARESARAIFIVRKDSPLKSIADVKGKSIVTPDLYSAMWRIANAMLRDSGVSLSKEKVRPMRDQAAIGWSMENGFFDVGVVNSVSAVGRTWEKNGGRVLARSPETPNMPLIASSQLSPAQIAAVRTTLIGLDSAEGGAAVLKNLGITGFKDTSSKEYIDLLAWLGEIPVNVAKK